MEDFQIKVTTDVIAPDQNITKRNLLYEFSQSHGNGSKTGAFVLQITDPADPMFLYDYQLNPQDYPALKEELNLFGEYPGFSQSVYDLLTKCVEQEDHSAVIDQHKYQTPTLLLQQRTQMALLTPFRVPLITASPTRLNQFLTSEVNKYKSLYFEKTKNCNDVETEVQNLHKQMEDMNQQFQLQFQTHSNEYDTKLQQVTQQYESQISELKSKFKNSSQLALTERQKSESDLTTKYETQIADLRQQISQLTEEKTNEMLQKVSNEEKLKNVETQLKDMTSAKLQLDSEKKDLSEQLAKMSASSTEYMTKVESLNSTITLLKAEAAHNQQLLDNNNKQIEKMQEEITKKDEEIAQLNERSSDKEKKVQEHDWIVSKSKQVIERFIAESKEHKEKIAQLKADIAQKDNQIKECQIQAASDKASIEALNDNIKRILQEKEELSQKLADSQTQNKELTTKLDGEGKIVEMLNKRLNDFEINGGTPTDFNFDLNDYSHPAFEIPTSTSNKSSSSSKPYTSFKSDQNQIENIWEAPLF